MTASPPRIVVAVCTFRRNEPLRRLLEALVRNQHDLGDDAVVGVSVVDDNPDGRARSVCDDFVGSFRLGLEYCTSGQGNISVARNLGLESALPRADWIAMTDDDCEPVDTWLRAHIDAQNRSGSDASTGPCELVPAPGAPRWLTEQPFLDDGQFRFADGTQMTTAATNNSFIRAAFLRDAPDLRFDPELGVVGGEDMVFYRSAQAQGLTITFAADAVVRGYEPPERCTYAHQLKSRFWLGNTEFVTNQRLGEARRPRWFARGARGLLVALGRPVVRLARREAPQIRYSTAAAARAVGTMLGAAGLRVDHH